MKVDLGEGGMLPQAPQEGYDLFVSYARADDRGEDMEKVSALVRAIMVDYEGVIGTPLSGCASPPTRSHR